VKRRLQELLSSNRKLGDYEAKVALLSQEIERLTGQLEKKSTETSNLKGRLSEIDSMNKTIGSLQEKITRLVSENTEISGEVQNAQNNLRLSANQNNKIMQELNDYKQRIEQNNLENNNLKQKINKLVSENNNLGEEARAAQESLRLSSATQAKLNAELNMYR
jgi:chromosome segregation ATPase